MEFYLLNYFKPALARRLSGTRYGKQVMEQIGCTRCHIPDLRIEHDRRVADVETVFDPVQRNLQPPIRHRYSFVCQ